MVKSIFQSIREQETPEKNYRWYLDAIRRVGLASLTAQRTMKTDIGFFVTTITPGDMYLFAYDPKTKDSLPFYDTFPIAIPFRRVPGGFYALNMHYLPPMMRMRLLGRLLEYTNDKTISETTRFKLRWSLLDNASRFPGVHACVKRYLFSHVNSRMLKIKPADWKKTILLPIDNFKKATRQQVYNDSKDKL